MPMTSASSSEMASEDEIAFLALHHLHQYDTNPDVANALDMLESALTDLQKLPTAIDYTGAEHALTYAQCSQRFRHVPRSHLRNLLRVRQRISHNPSSTWSPSFHLSSNLRKRPRPCRIDCTKRRLIPGFSNNVTALVHQYSCLSMSFPLQPLTLRLLPNAFRRIKRLIGHHAIVFATIFDHSSQLLVSGSDDHLIKIWSTDDAYLQHTLRGHDSNITDIVRHPTQPIIVSASSDSTLRVWDVTTGAALYVLDGGSKEVNAVHFSPCPDRPYLVAGGADGTVRIWNADNFASGFTRVPIPHPVRRPSNMRTSGDSVSQPMAFTSAAAPSSPRAPSIGPSTATGRPSVSTSNILPMGSARPLSSPRSQPAQSQLSNPPHSIADQQPQPALQTSPPTVTITAIDVSPSSNAIASNPVPLAPSTSTSNPLGALNDESTRNMSTAGDDNNSRPSPEVSMRNNGPAGSVVSGTPMYEVLSVCFNVGGTRLAVGGSDCLVHLYAVDVPLPANQSSDTAQQPSSPQIRHLTTLPGHSEAIIQVLFSRAGDRLVSAARDGTARIWKRVNARLPQGKKSLQNVAGMGSWKCILLDCRIQPQMETRSVFSGAASGSACGSIVPRTMRCMIPTSMCAVAWSIDDKYVITSSSDAKIRVWDSQTGVLLRVLEGHEQQVFVIDFHPWNQDLMLTAGYDGKCILWDVESGRLLRTFVVGAEEIVTGERNPTRPTVPVKRPSICNGQFSLDGLSFVVSDTSGAITLFGIGSKEMAANAPEEQFFSDEHAPIRRDSQQRVVHESTGQLLHLLARGRLCDRNYLPHPADRQPKFFHSATTAQITETPGASTLGPVSRISNQHYNMLVARARECRVNQEREDKRLQKEAHRMLQLQRMKQEKAYLLHDTDPQYLALGDFEVPDSDYEDPDADFDIDNANLEQDDSSSSSSDDKLEFEEEGDDEIQPVTKGSSRKESSRGQSGFGKPQKLRANAGHLSKARKAKRQLQSIDFQESGEEENSRRKAESPAYEVGSHETDSDDSASSDGNIPKRPLKCVRSLSSKSDTGEDKQVEKGDGLMVELNYDRSAPLAREPCSLGLGVASQSEAPIVASRTLAGASIVRGGRRIKISTRLRPRTQSITSGRRTSREMSNSLAHSQNESERFQNLADENSPSFVDQRIPVEAMGTSFQVASGNPSHTTERTERGVGASGTRRGTIPIEDHQEDTASCYQSRSLSETGAKGQSCPFGGNSHYQASTRTLNSEDGEKLIVDEVGSDKAREASFTRGGIEKSSLSDSPGRVNAVHLRTRSRNGSAKAEFVENATAAFVDIDAIAEQELEMLNASRRKRKRSRSRISTMDSEEKQSGEEEIEAVREPDNGLESRRLRRRRNGKVPDKDRVIADVDGNRRSLSSSDWLRSSNNRFTYIPQIGDDVMYFAEGHIASIETARGLNLEPVPGNVTSKQVGAEILDGTTLGKNCPPLRFRILDIAYEFPSAYQKASKATNAKVKGGAKSFDKIAVHGNTVMVLTMRLESGLKLKTSQNDRFILSYFTVDMPEYLVLTSRVNAALVRSWKEGDRFRILFVNEKRAWQYYKGTIRKVLPTMHKTLWNTIEVEYDNETEMDIGNTDLVSPWELEPFDMSQCSTTHGLSASTNTTVPPGLLPTIANELDQLRMSESIWRSQCSWIDSLNEINAMPAYCETIPCPIDFDIIMVRLCTGYYRHYAAFLHDVKLLNNNAIRFHGEHSEAGQLTTRVCTSLIEIGERTNAYFTAAMASGTPVHVSGIPGLSGPGASRNPWLGLGLPEFSSLVNHTPIPNAISGGVRTCPVSSATRPVTPGSFSPANGPEAMSGSQPRSWRGASTSHGQSLGMSHLNHYSFSPTLPPTSPYGSSGVSTRVARGARGAGRVRNVRHQDNHAHKQVGMNKLNSPLGFGPSTIGGGRWQSSVSPVYGFGTGMSMSAKNGPHAGANLAVASNSSGLGGAIPTNMRASQSNQTVSVPTSSTLEMNNATAGVVHVGNKTPTGTATHTTPALPPFSSIAMPHATHGYSIDENVSSPPGGAGNNLRGTSITLPSGHIALSRNPGTSMGGGSNGGDSGSGRCGSIADIERDVAGSSGMRMGDGITHSWSQSMEGAGGTIPIQASTSDSHLAKRRDRSQSPSSPGRHEVRGERNDRQATSTTGNDGGITAYHEHSIVSMAAAESTMSCGGVDGVLQAASAESFDMASSRTQSNSRKVQ